LGSVGKGDKGKPKASAAVPDWTPSASPFR
jgi:hypothetical protein